jgi:hypothetical protein
VEHEPQFAFFPRVRVVSGQGPSRAKGHAACTVVAAFSGITLCWSWCRATPQCSQAAAQSGQGPCRRILPSGWRPGRGRLPWGSRRAAVGWHCCDRRELPREGASVEAAPPAASFLFARALAPRRHRAKGHSPLGHKPILGHTVPYIRPRLSSLPTAVGEQAQRLPLRCLSRRLCMVWGPAVRDCCG